jgi:hypothetical protein
LRDLGRDESRSARGEDFVSKMQKLHDQINRQLHNSNHKYKNIVDQRRREVNFEIGDQVSSHRRMERFMKGKYNKMKMKRIGCSKILIKLSTNAYKIEFPEDIQISPIFNVVDLYPYKMDDT